MELEKKKCLIVDEMHHTLPPMLEDIGFEVDYRPRIKKNEIPPILDQYHCFIVRSKIYVGDDLLKASEKLKYVVRAGAGVDNIDVAALSGKGIRLINAPEGNRDALAEHTMGMLLCLLNNINQADGQVRKSVWDREGNRGVELMGKTVGLVGYGFMGKALAKRLSAFGCHVIGYDKYLSGFSDDYCEETTMKGIFNDADVLSLHVPLTEETKKLVDEKYLMNFRKPIYLLNTARGGILCLKGLRRCIENEKIKGVALDVLENENLDAMTELERQTFEYLIQSPKTVFTPHVAGWSVESYERINKVLVTKLKEEVFGN